MAPLILTLENTQKAVKIIADVVSGWSKAPMKGYGFRGRGSIDYVNDTRLVAKVDVFPPSRIAHSLTFFPNDIEPHRYGIDSLYYDLRRPRLDVILRSTVRRYFTLGKSAFFGGPKLPSQMVR